MQAFPALNQLPNFRRVRVVQVTLGDVSRIQVELHPRSRLSETNRPLSPFSFGNLARNGSSCRNTLAGEGRSKGRSSATGTPRFSMTITCPCATCFTMALVRKCKSRMLARFMCHMNVTQFPGVCQSKSHFKSLFKSRPRPASIVTITISANSLAKHNSTLLQVVCGSVGRESDAGFSRSRGSLSDSDSGIQVSRSDGGRGIPISAGT